MFGPLTQPGAVSTTFAAGHTYSPAELETQRTALRDEAAQIAAILNSATEDAIITLNLDGQVTRWNAGAERITGYAAADVLGCSAEFVFTPEDRAKGAFDGELRLASEQGRAPNERWHLRKNGTRFWASGWMLPLVTVDGSAAGFLNTFRDSTATHGDTERSDLLLGEMSHRISNLLTIVRSIAAQTARHTAGLKEFLPTFDARLTALARSQTLLSSPKGDGACLHDLLTQTLAFLGSDAERISLNGPSAHLPANIVLMLSLAMHELATNAFKYGSLSVPDGWIELSWTVQQGLNGASSVGIIWSELGGPPVQPPSRKGFGSQLLQRGLAREPGTTVAIDYAESGVDCRIRTPLQPTSSEPGRSAAQRGTDLPKARRRAWRPERVLRNILWYDRVQTDLDACRHDALIADDLPRARRALLLRIWADDRTELLAKQTG